MDMMRDAVGPDVDLQILTRSVSASPSPASG
jgi:hypothetical protein